MSTKTPIEDFLPELNGGVLQEKYEMFLSQIALATRQYGGKKKGKLTLEITFEELNDCQIKLKHKIQAVTPSMRGHKLEVDTTETPMFVGRGGRMSIMAPKEDADGQGNFDLTQQQDGPPKDTSKDTPKGTPSKVSPLR